MSKDYKTGRIPEVSSDILRVSGYTQQFRTLLTARFSPRRESVPNVHLDSSETHAPGLIWKITANYHSQFIKNSLVIGTIRGPFAAYSRKRFFSAQCHVAEDFKQVQIDFYKFVWKKRYAKKIGVGNYPEL
ncbi:unnamed protein product [Strongylus vulgaris]|uniref:Uncharacterized protein n=1 Tax=Strongylus vulgaris TaxID=40348 RepID=A0A3P7LE62_STRVU|nr:unnamed protein product [Strongylus vulgaris]